MKRNASLIFDTMVFDLDGTLVDSAPAILACLEATVTAAGHAAVVPLKNDLIGPPLRETLAWITGLSDVHALESLAADFTRRYDVEVGKITQPFPGVSELLAALHDQGVRLHLATNKRNLPTRRILEAQNWHALFRSVYAQDQIPGGYPSKATMLGRMLKEQGIPPGRAAYIGDTKADYDSALANRLAFVAVSWGYGGKADSWGISGQWHCVSEPMDILELGRDLGGLNS